MKNIRQHILFWIIFFFICYITDSILDPDTTFVKEIIFFSTQNVFLFYSFLFFLRRYSATTKTALLISIAHLLLNISVFIALRYSVRYWLLAIFFQKEYGQLSIREWLTASILWMIEYFFFASGYYYFQSAQQKQKALQKSLQEQLVQEKEKAQLEITALRAQINPHFLYNTLDFLYAQALPLSERLSDGIIRLSEMMRYSIRPQDEQGLVYLSEEIQHLENVIEIHQLRFDHMLHICLETPDRNTNGIRIIPLVLITLVENVLKHGRLNDPRFPAIIRIGITADALLMITSNQKRDGPRELSSGIGLDNTRKRLAALYGNRYTLDTQDEASGFHTTLRIPIKHPLPVSYEHQLYYPG